MISMTGICNFCGQTRMVELPDSTSEAFLTEEACSQASMECNCKEGSGWRAEMLVIEKCSENIEMMFRDSYPEIADIFQEAKMLIYNGTFKKITCSTATSGTALMFMRGGSIIIRFVQQNKTELSADW